MSVYSTAQASQRAQEEEFRTVQPGGKTLCRGIGQVDDSFVVPTTVGVVGHGIKRILDFAAVTCIALKVGVSHEHRQVALRVFVGQTRPPPGCFDWLIPPGVEQKEVIINVIHRLKVGKVPDKTLQRSGRQREVFELVFLNQPGVIESVLDDFIRRCHGLGRERDLLQVVFTLVRVVLRRISHGFHGFGDAVGAFLSQPDRILRLVVDTSVVQRSQHSPIRAAPVVFQSAPAPLALERLLALAHDHRVIEIPLVVARGARRTGTVSGQRSASATSFLRPRFGGGISFRATCFLFLTLQFFNHTVNGGQAVSLGHTRQFLQTVLQMHGRCVRHQSVEHLGTPRNQVVFFVFLIEQADGFGIAGLCLVILLAFPPQAGKTQEKHPLLNAAPSAFFPAFFIGTYGGGRVAQGEMNVAHGVIDLVKVVLVVVGTCHAAQPAYHLFRVGLGREYLRLLYACVESQLVRRTLTQAALVGLVGIGWASELRIDLPEQIVTARLLLVALFGFHRPFKIGQRLG
ncbi:unknown [Prevotella sp. CAG:755]|nr:unknown [Prevotella sp. CAG:755]